MKHTENRMVLLSVPAELLDEIGLDEMDVIQMGVTDGKLVIEKADSEDYACDGDCDSCPFGDMDCDGDCASCPCSYICDESEVDEDD